MSIPSGARWRLASGERRDDKTCDSLQSQVTTLFKRAGLKCSSHNGRRGLAGKVLALTGDMDTVAILLGHSSIDCSQRYVDVDPATLKVVFASAL